LSANHERNLSDVYKIGLPIGEPQLNKLIYMFTQQGRTVQSDTGFADFRVSICRAPLIMFPICYVDTGR